MITKYELKELLESENKTSNKKFDDDFELAISGYNQDFDCDIDSEKTTEKEFSIFLDWCQGNWEKNI